MEVKAKIDSPYFDYKMAAEYLHLSEQTLRRSVQYNLISFIKIGNRVLFKKSDLDNFMEERRVTVERKNK